MDLKEEGAFLLQGRSPRVKCLKDERATRVIHRTEALHRSVITLLGMMFCQSALLASTLHDESMASVSSTAVWIGRIHIESVETVSVEKFPVSQVAALVVEVLKGSGDIGQKLSFLVPGGRDSGLTRRVLGFPQFKGGSDYIVFLDRDPRDQVLSDPRQRANVTSWSAYKVIERDGQAMVIRAGEATLSEKSAHGYSLVHDRGVKTYEAFVDSLYRSLN